MHRELALVVAPSVYERKELMEQRPTFILARSSLHEKRVPQDLTAQGLDPPAFKIFTFFLLQL